MASKLIHCALALATGFGALAVDENVAQGPSLTKAEAVIGRPLTPMSYAGVARRTTRRAAYTGAAYAGAATAAYAGAAYAAGAATAYAGSPQTCVQTVDAYGQVVTRC
jgi:hypothetical protein